MLLRELKYYFMTNEELEREILRLRFKLDNATEPRKIKKYLDALADIVKMLIRKYRNDDDFMREVRWSLYSLKAQAEEAAKKCKEKA